MASVTDHPESSASPTREIVSDSLAVGVTFALALTVIQRAVGFLRGILFCRMMEEQELGQWSLVWSFLMLLAPLAVLGLPGCFGRYVEHYRQRGQLRSFILRVALISGITTTAMACYIALNREQISWFIFRESSELGMAVALAVGVSIVLVAQFNFLISLLEALRQVRLVTLMRFILGVGFAAIGTSMLFFSQQAAVAVTYAYAISCLVASVPAYWFLTRFRSALQNNGDTIPKWNMWQRIAPFALWLWIVNLFSNMFEIADRYMLIHCSQVEAVVAQGFVGQYHSGRVLPLLLVSVAAVLAGILMPYMSEAWESRRRQQARTQLNWTIKLVAIGFTAGAFLMLVMAPLLFDGILRGRYNDGLAILPLTFVYCIWYSIVTVGQDMLWVAEKGKWALAAVGLGLLANIGLNAFMIPQFGLWGAVIATSIANAVMLMCCFLLNHWIGCRTDAGVWMTVPIPLLLLLPTLLGATCLVMLAWCSYRTHWIFNEREKAELRSVYAKVCKKLAGGSS